MPGNAPNSPASKGLAELTALWTTAGKILAQELRTGCADRLVFGGLERYLERWSSSVYDTEGGYPTRPEAAQVLRLLAGYAGRSVEEREAGVSAALAVAQQLLDRLASLPMSDRPSAAGAQRLAASDPSKRNSTKHTELRAQNSAPVIQPRRTLPRVTS